MRFVNGNYSGRHKGKCKQLRTSAPVLIAVQKLCMLRIGEAHTRYPLSVTRYPLSVARYPLSVVRCPLSVIRCPLSVIR
jgi:hypothetical protein